MDDIERYAVELVAHGGESCAEDDLNEDDEPLSDEDWRAACNLGVNMARAIAENPEEFRNWYRLVTR